ncbi:BamA/OMP85 family outer membrane protein [Halanaerobacter jeridensis]|uniref:Outer membrane protein insertion porin family n=1 Tax=Halanaerobacter jeridensis TaxID=706427 RepID=A0A938XPI0_9FIRM|nr:BamA/TamA family outer membrane protein [Halanaerobacter jeridensis]MBM7556993.1 outer membrane protein insertion porin family [Halanaerobacter jeridensis]
MNKKLIIINLALILILLNLTVVAAQSQELENNKVDKLAGQKITAIEIEGNKVISDQQVLKEVTTTVGSQLDQQQLQKDLQSIFDLGYFFDVQVLFEEYKSGIKLIFEVIENPEITEIKVMGNDHLAKSKIKELLGVKLPKVLNVSQLNEGMKAVNEYYREQGYILASITDVTIKNKNQLHLTINEGYINQIKIEGNEKTKKYVITREMTTQPGQVLNVEQLREDITNIYRLGYFKSIIPEFNRLEDSQQVDVIIKVEEQKTGNFNIGVGYSSTAKFTGMINIEKDNLGGRGQKVNLNWEFGGERNNFEIGFYEPWAFGTQTSLDFNIYDRNETTEDDVDVSKEGGNVTIGRPLTEDIKGYLDLDYSTIKENFSDGGSNSDNTMSLTLRTIRDTRDNLLSPRTGERQEISIQKSGFWGTADYSKYKLDWREYFPVGDEDSVALRFKMATSEGDLPSTERYYLSSLDAVRGYNDDYYKEQDTTGDGTRDYIPEENGFIGESLLLANFEYRKKLWDNITGVTFVDVGNAFERDDLSIDDFNYSVGLGIRFDTPVGQLGLDYGYAPEGRLEEKSDFSISLGNKF